MPESTRREFVLQTAAALSLPIRRAEESSTNQILWFRQPARQWTEAFLIGNGRLGGIVWGGIATERIQLNEDTLWSGFPRNWNNPAASQYLPEIRRAVLDHQDYHQADELCKKMQGPYNQSYLPLADLILHFGESEPADNYRRELSLESGIARITYQLGEIRFLREYFVSFPDQVIAIQLTASAPSQLHFTLKMESALQASSSAAGNQITLAGKAPAQVQPDYLHSSEPVLYDPAEGKGMRFAALARVAIEGGTVSASGQALTVKGSTAATILVGAGTGFRGPHRIPDLPFDEIRHKVDQQLNAASARSYSTLRRLHVEDHQLLYSRVSLSLGGGSDAPTDERLQTFKTDHDPDLLALYFHYGRYLLIASSRPGTQPANLQGIWNPMLRPPWSSNWTANINVQMNYWPAEVCDLSPCHETLFRLIEELRENGAVTAAVNYKLPGWVSHHNVDLWKQSAPVGDFGHGSPTWANWPMSGPWLCAHLWQHYEFTRDLAFLRRAYPVMRGAAEFFLGWLIPGPDGKLTTCPSLSTENSFRAPDGKRAETSAGCTMDIALARELFRNSITAASLLGLDQPLARRLEHALTRLPNYRVGKHGQLQEWNVDFDETEPGQRHMSHLYGLYPGVEITPRQTPELAKAARISLERRLAAGGAYTGWSRAWAINFWARLLDGERAYESLAMLLLHSTTGALLDTHPAGDHVIFQIDGNFGGAAAIAEMLLQSHDDAIAFLPSLPPAWQRGRVSGLMARGGVKVSIEWADSRARSATLEPRITGEFRLRAPARQHITLLEASNGSRVSAQTGEIRALLEAGVSYRVHFDSA